MKLAVTTVVAVLVLGAAVALTDFASAGAGVSPVAAQEHELPGMCNGRKDPNIQVTAQNNGKGDTKFILNIATDQSANASGVLVLGRGKDRIQVIDWCRVWQHTPDSQPGQHCEADGPPEGAITAHAVGITTLKSGDRLLVRADVRETEEGAFFRIRYRTLGTHDDGGCGDEGGCEDGGHEPGGEEGCEDATWTRIPGEGWAQLDQLRVKGH